MGVWVITQQLLLSCEKSKAPPSTLTATFYGRLSEEACRHIIVSSTNRQHWFYFLRVWPVMKAMMIFCSFLTVDGMVNAKALYLACCKELPRVVMSPS